jgi:putative membrane protein
MSNITLKPSLQKNERKAKILIYTVSIIVFAVVVVLSSVKLNLNLPFNPHVFATFNAIINSLVAILLLAGLWSIRQRKFLIHKKIMLVAIILSVFFLLSYIAHHLLAGETKFGDVNHNGILDENENLQVGNIKIVYYILLLTHIPLAAIILPFILFTAYRSLTGEYEKHKKLARITWPIWFYVAVSGVVVYLMIQPYYT